MGLYESQVHIDHFHRYTLSIVIFSKYKGTVTKPYTVIFLISQLPEQLENSLPRQWYLLNRMEYIRYIHILLKKM